VGCTGVIALKKLTTILLFQPKGKDCFNGLTKDIGPKLEVLDATWHYLQFFTSFIYCRRDCYSVNLSLEVVGASDRSSPLSTLIPSYFCGQLKLEA
jgi:hypothetical protein